MATATWLLECIFPSSVYTTYPNGNYNDKETTLETLNMPPASPWGKKSQQNNSSTGYPGIKNHIAKNEPPQSQYQEIQEDELIALASIYGEDFRSIEKKQTAWQVRGYQIFKVLA